jgi:hypothetical protein
MAQPCLHCGESLKRSRYNSTKTKKSCPNCSQGNGKEHVFHPFPDSFGLTPARANDEDPDGAQSWCTGCRANGTPTPGVSCGARDKP